jgi:hypothetical protein
MGSISEIKLSESDRGRPIGITEIASPGNLLHIATDEELPEGYDKVYLYAVNVTEADHTLYVQWGGTDSSDLVPYDMAAGTGAYLTIPANLLMGGAEVRAYADLGDAINVFGSVIRAAALGEPGFTNRVL